MEISEYRRNDELEPRYWWFAGVRAMVESLLKTSGLSGSLGKVLDVGCGTGALIDALHGRSEEIWGVDSSAEALRFCARRGLRCVTLADAAAVPLPSGYFDLVTAVGIIEHVSADGAFLSEMHRLVKPGGVLLLLTSSFPFLWSMHDVANQHYRRYYLKPLRGRIEAAGFATVRFSHLNFLLFPLLAPGLLLHRWVVGLESEHPRRILPRPPRAINALLTQILRLEAMLMRKITLPWGISMIGAFRRRDLGSAVAPPDGAELT